MAMNAVWTNRDDDADSRPPLDSAQPGQAVFSWYAQGFSDPLGDRLLLFDNTSGAPLELLRLCPELSGVPGFEPLVRERATQLDGFEDERHARVCRVDRLPDPGGGLALVSERSHGRRLSEILHLAEEHHLQPSGEIVQRLLADIVGAVAAFHAIGPHIAHGALGPERLVMAPGGHLLVTEYVLGSALPRVALDRASFWRRLRVALPADPALPAFDQRTDVLQIGTIALALVLGRMLRNDDYPDHLAELLAEAGDRLVLAGWGRLGAGFHGWLLRMLQLDRDQPITNGMAAGHALREVGSIDDATRFGSGAVEAFVRACSRRPGTMAIGGGTPSLEASRPLPALAPAPGVDDRMPSTDRLPSAANIASDALAPADEQTGDHAPGTMAAPTRQPLVRDDRTFERARWKQVALIVLLIIATAEGLIIGGRALLGGRTVSPQTGAVAIESIPTQATVVVDGRRVGATPIKLDLAPGRHVLEVASGSRRRSIVVTTAAGTNVSHHLELPEPPAETGKLRVVTTPPGGRVLVDGQPSGVSPIVVEGLAAGSHEVVVEGRQGSVRQRVDVEQNSTASLFVPLPGASAPAPGWLTVESPVELAVYEDAEMLGTSKSPRIMLPAGRHEVLLAAEGVGFRTTREIQVPAGGTATLQVAVPETRIDINAMPWAEVSIDNRRVGETPLGGVSVPIGRHTVTFRHPQLGERTVDCLVTLQGPARLSVDLRK